jgi:hypothetical protein
MGIRQDIEIKRVLREFDAMAELIKLLAKQVDDLNARIKILESNNGNRQRRTASSN